MTEGESSEIDSSVRHWWVGTLRLYTTGRVTPYMLRRRF